MTGKNLEEILKIQQKDLQVEDENKKAQSQILWDLGFRS